MFQSKTLFVVGAGASKEAGLPTAIKLTATIANMVDIKFRNFNEQFSGEHEIANALRSHVRDVDGRPGDINPYLHACWHIRDAMPQAISIDNFIDHQGDEKIDLCGKLAIVRSILEAERKSLIFFDERQGNSTLNYEGLEGTWYKSFMQILTDGCRKENINQLFEDVSFVIFNYDRCIEHFLFNTLQNYYGIQSDEAAILMQALKIIHPYGMVGRMQWQGELDGIPFGTNIGGSRLLSLAGQIKTFTQRVEDKAAITEIHQVVQEAEVVVFLGFSFHPQNMELIKPTPRGTAKRVFATAKGISKSDCAIVEKQILDLFDTKLQNIQIDLRNDLLCHGLFDEYRRNLSLS